MPASGAAENIRDPSTYPTLRLGPSEAAALGPLPAPMRRAFTRSKGALIVPTHDAVIAELLTRVDSSELRRKVSNVVSTAFYQRANKIIIGRQQYYDRTQRLAAFSFPA